MTQLSPITQHFVSENEIGVSMISCERFRHCASLTGGNDVHLGSVATEKLDGTHFTSSLWVKVDNMSTTLDFLVGGKGWSLREGKIKLTDTAYSAEEVITTGNWHYICWVKGQAKQALYVDGKLIQHNDSRFIADSNGTVVFTSEQGFTIELAHLHNYARSLTVTEMLVDQNMQTYPATQTFNEYYPLDVNIINTDPDFSGFPDNKIYITDKHLINSNKTRMRQTLSIQNITNKDIVFEKKSAVTQEAHHFELRLRNAVFIQPDEYPKIAGNDDWIISDTPIQNTEDGSWSIYISAAGANVSLHAGKSIDFEYEYASADGSLGERSVTQMLSYKGLAFKMGGPIEGVRNKRLDILNLPSRITYPLCASYTSTHGIHINTTTDNNALSFYIYNRSEGSISFSDKSNVKVKIPYGDSDTDLADAASETGKIVSSYIEYHDGRTQPDAVFKKETNPDLKKSIFIWTPGAIEIPANSFIKLVIDKFRANCKPGTAFIDVEINGIDNYGDAILPLAITKTAINDLAKLLDTHKVGIFTDDPQEDFHVKGNTKIDKTLKIVGDTELDNTRIFGDLNVHSMGITTFYGDITADSKVTFNDNLDVSEDVNVNKNVTIGADLSVAGEVTSDLTIKDGYRIKTDTIQARKVVIDDAVTKPIVFKSYKVNYYDLQSCLVSMPGYTPAIMNYKLLQGKEPIRDLWINQVDSEKWRITFDSREKKLIYAGDLYSPILLIEVMWVHSSFSDGKGFTGITADQNILKRGNSDDIILDEDYSDDKVLNTLPPNCALYPGDYLLSKSMKTQLLMNYDGNLYLYKNTAGKTYSEWDNDAELDCLWRSVWKGAVGDTGDMAWQYNPVTQSIMQSDGNFVQYYSDHYPLTWSDTSGHPGSALYVDDDYFCIKDTANNILWQSDKSELCINADSAWVGKFATGIPDDSL